MTFLINLVQLLIFPGLLFCVVFGVLMAGIDRKLVARMQRRVGPPILQPWYDFVKCCAKETIIPRCAKKAIFIGAPYLGLACLIVIALFIPVGSADHRRCHPHHRRLLHWLPLRRRGSEP